MNIAVCNALGAPISDAFLHADNPENQLHKRMDIAVRIPSARGLRWIEEDSSRGVCCKYKFYTDSKVRSTKSVYHTRNPNFAYAKQFTVKDVSHSFLEYLKSNALVIELWGKQGDITKTSVAHLQRQRSLKVYNCLLVA